MEKGWFKWDPSIGILSLASFALSLTAALYSLTIFLRGAQLEIAEPKWLVVFRNEVPGYSDHLYLGAEFTYSNRGGDGYNAVVTDEFLHFSLKNRKYRFVWRGLAHFSGGDQACRAILAQNSKSSCKKESSYPYSCGKSDGKISLYNCPGEGRKLGVEIFNSAKAQVVIGGSAVTHESFFEPYEESCVRLSIQECKDIKSKNWLPWAKFAQDLSVGDKIKFLFSIRDSDGNEKTSQCIVTIRQEEIHRVRHRGWDKWNCES